MNVITCTNWETFRPRKGNSNSSSLSSSLSVRMVILSHCHTAHSFYWNYILLPTFLYISLKITLVECFVSWSYASTSLTVFISFETVGTQCYSRPNMWRFIVLTIIGILRSLSTLGTRIKKLRMKSFLWGRPRNEVLCFVLHLDLEVSWPLLQDKNGHTDVLVFCGSVWK